MYWNVYEDLMRNVDENLYIYFILYLKFYKKLYYNNINRKIKIRIINIFYRKRIHPAPTISVFPGAFSKLKISSLVIPYSKAPGISGYLGLPPTAIRIFWAVNSFSSPFFSFPNIVCWSLK